MSKHFENDLEKLKNDILDIGARVESSVDRSLLAFRERDVDLAHQVIEDDHVIDSKEVELEEDCLKALALYQPVAQDLRFIASVIKMNKDLERMGDCAVKISRRTLSLAKEPPIEFPDLFKRMIATSLEMVRSCLDAFVQKDPKLAREICEKDNELDETNRELIKQIRSHIKDHPADLEQGLDLITTTQGIERIGDLATNICEYIVYMVEGEIIRHQG